MSESLRSVSGQKGGDGRHKISSSICRQLCSMKSFWKAHYRKERNKEKLSNLFEVGWAGGQDQLVGLEGLLLSRQGDVGEQLILLERSLPISEKGISESDY